MKYDCPDMMDLLVDYFEDELSEDQRAHLESHLGGCPPCAAFLQSYQNTGVVSRAALAKAMPAELKGQLISFLRSEIEDS